MTEAIMAFYAHNVWSKQHIRKTQRTLHWLLQAIGSGMAIAGMIIEFVSRDQAGKSHFKSTHSIVGLTAGICTLIGMLNGVSALWSVELKKYARPVYFKLVHNFNGIAAFVLGKGIYFTQQTVVSRSQTNTKFAIHLITYFHLLRNDNALFWLR